MDNIDTHNVNYNGYNVVVKLVGRKFIETEYTYEELRTLEVIIKDSNGNTLYFGNLYSKLPKTMTEEEITKLVKNIVDNLDEIVFDKEKYVGFFHDEVEEDIISALKSKYKSKSDEELGNIYLEFLNTKKDPKEHYSYSLFLEAYFASNPIPDSVKKVFLERKRDKILDYTDLDYEIKRDFSDNICESYGTRSDYDQNKINLLEIKKEITSLIPYLEGLEEIIDKINELLSKLEHNKKIKGEIILVENEIEQEGLFSRKKGELKKKLKEVQNKLIPVNIREERELLRKLIEEKYVSKDIEFKDILKLFDNTSLENIKMMLTEIYNAKVDRYNDLKNRYDSIYGEIEYYERNEVNLESFYERVDNPSRK